MSTQLNPPIPDESPVAVRSTSRSPRRRLARIVALAVAVLAAGGAGIATAAYFADDPAPSNRIVEPNANQREGRLPTVEPGEPAVTQPARPTGPTEPNANQREGRVTVSG